MRSQFATASKRNVRFLPFAFTEHGAIMAIDRRLTAVGYKIMKTEPRGEIVIYRTRDGKTTLDVNLTEDTVWLTQVQLSKLFAKDRRTISEHISNVFKEKELQKDRTIRKLRIVQQIAILQHCTAYRPLDLMKR